MDKRLKQRLIGAAVLVALAVIFVPMLLQGPVQQDFSQVPIEIPPQPVVATAPGVPAPEPKPPVEPVPTPVYQAEPAPTVAASPQPEPAPEQKPTVAAAAKPEPKPKPAAPVAADEPVSQPRAGALEAWVVQVGSFGVNANAQGLSDKLRKQGYPAFVDKISSQGRTFYRVRVGPIAKRDEAERVRAKIDKSEGLKGQILSHP